MAAVHEGVGLANGSQVTMTITPKTTIEGVTEVTLTRLLKSLPDFPEEKAQVDATVLNDEQEMFIAGLKSYGELEFGFNYAKKEFLDLKKIKDAVCDIEITLSDGLSISFSGQISVTLSAQSVGELREMTVTAIVGSDIAFA